VTLGKSDTARAAILARIRRAQGKAAQTSPAEAQAVDAYIRAKPRGPVRPLEADLVARFRARAESMQSTTESVATLDDVPAVTARYLAALSLPTAGCVSPQLAALDWRGAGLTLEPRAARDADLVGATGVLAAIAETGTLMVASGHDTPASVSLLPETHIAVLSVTRVVATMEDAWALLRREHGQLPRLVNFISGPSRTGDIDQTIVLGAHGPYRVHMILVREGAG
jgi:L-lactate dehydrogenase complex protein LldG